MNESLGTKIVGQMACYQIRMHVDRYTNLTFEEKEDLCSHFIEYRQVSNIRRTLVGNKIVDHSDVVGASPVGAAPTTSSFST